MLHFVTFYMKQNKSRKQTLESAQYGLEISFKSQLFHLDRVLEFKTHIFSSKIVYHELSELSSTHVRRLNQPVAPKSL